MSYYLMLMGLLSLTLAAEGMMDRQLLQSFKEFNIKFGKNYVEGTEEFDRRLRIFANNVIKINQWKKEAIARKSKGMPGITKYADMTEEEFRDKMLLANLQNSVPCKTSKVAADLAETFVSSIPSSFDWRSKGAVTPVKDQGSVGTCWAFSTTGNIEGQWFLKGNTLVGLSEEQLNDCDPYDCGVFGGWPCRAYQYVIQAGGLMSEEAYPYCVGNGNCYPCPPPKYNETFCGPGPEYCNSTEYPCRANSKSEYSAHISNWQSFSTNETQLAAQLVSNGPLSVLIDAGSGIPPLQYHEWGVWDPWYCDPSALDHAVLLVGYGMDGSTPYWLVKNSWGTDWSNDGGYFMMRRGTGLCGVNTGATSAIV